MTFRHRTLRLMCIGPSVFHAPSSSSTSIRRPFPAISHPSSSVLRVRDPPSSCSVVGINSRCISVYFAVIILRPPSSVTLRVPVCHAPMLHTTDHRPFRSRSLATHRPHLRPLFQSSRSRFCPLAPPCHSCHRHSSLSSTILRSPSVPATPGHCYPSDLLCHLPAAFSISIRCIVTLHIPCFPSFV